MYQHECLNVWSLWDLNFWMKCNIIKQGLIKFTKSDSKDMVLQNIFT